MRARVMQWLKFSNYAACRWRELGRKAANRANIARFVPMRRNSPARTMPDTVFGRKSRTGFRVGNPFRPIRPMRLGGSVWNSP